MWQAFGGSPVSDSTEIGFWPWFLELISNEPIAVIGLIAGLAAWLVQRGMNNRARQAEIVDMVGEAYRLIDIAIRRQKMLLGAAKQYSAQFGDLNPGDLTALEKVRDDAQTMLDSYYEKQNKIKSIDLIDHSHRNYILTKSHVGFARHAATADDEALQLLRRKLPDLRV